MKSLTAQHNEQINAMMADNMAYMKTVADNDRARMQGVIEGRQTDQLTAEMAKTTSYATKQGLIVMVMVGGLILMFLYNQVFQNDKKVFWIMAALLSMALLFRFAQIVKEDGGLAFGYYSM